MAPKIAVVYVSTSYLVLFSLLQKKKNGDAHHPRILVKNMGVH